MDPMEVAEKEYGRTLGIGDGFYRTSVLRNVHEKIEFVHQLWQLVSDIFSNQYLNNILNYQKIKKYTIGVLR